jgi:hypothetical protein
MKELVVVLRCDRDHSELADRTIPYMWGSVPLEIDLCETHAAEMEAAIRPYVEVSRKAKRKKAAKPSASIAILSGDGSLTPAKPAKRHSKGEQAAKALRDRVRAHANKHGIKQASTGYLRREAVDAWLLEHPRDAAALGRS